MRIKKRQTVRRSFESSVYTEKDSSTYRVYRVRTLWIVVGNVSLDPKEQQDDRGRDQLAKRDYDIRCLFLYRIFIFKMFIVQSKFYLLSVFLCAIKIYLLVSSLIIDNKIILLFVDLKFEIYLRRSLMILADHL